MSIDVTMIGELTLDEVVHEDGPCHWKQLGGGALYSAIGALAWGARPSISATIGEDYPEERLEQLESAGVDTSQIHRIDGASLSLWLLYEAEGRRHQVPKESSSSFATLDYARPEPRLTPPPLGVHVAPQTTEGQLRALDSLAAVPGLVVTQDLLVEPFVDRQPYLDGRAMRGTTAFLPSEQEVHQLWGEVDAAGLATNLRRLAGIEHLVIKRGPSGADVIGPHQVVRVPPAVTEVVDTTGAGDAFCGGFLVGLIETDDPVEATIRGAVSAALAVETLGADAALRVAAPRESHRRADTLRATLARA